MLSIGSYNLGDHVTNGIDISIPQGNYFIKYGSDGLTNQELFFKQLGLTQYFQDRVVVANAFDTKILEITDTSYSGYTGLHSNCNKFDGVITQRRQLPLFTAFGDCPQIMLVGKKTIGLIHGSRSTLDDRIIEIFFNTWRLYDEPSLTTVALSPYIDTKYFSHDYLSLNRIDDFKRYITESNKSYFIDLYGIIKQDLVKEGIHENMILNHRWDTWRISEESVRLGGYSISHRYANHHNAKEGRGGLVLMLK